ncbi:hypothetical protein NI25_34115 [Streptomyces sp. CCM_MD2014]|nr:hypothetical protein NI25_34115 [Streptomyces sp. CCM_MD2014]
MAPDRNLRPGATVRRRRLPDGAAGTPRGPGRTALFVAADTGHRCAGTVFGRHRDAVTSRK